MAHKAQVLLKIAMAAREAWQEGNCSLVPWLAIAHKAPMARVLLRVAWMSWAFLVELAMQRERGPGSLLKAGFGTGSEQVLSTRFYKQLVFRFDRQSQ